MKISFITMQKNEKDLLEGFINHHSNLSSLGDIYILDNGSDDLKTKEILEKYQTLGVNVYFEYAGREHFEKKGDVVKDFIAKKNLQEKYDFIIPMDCDEIFCIEGKSTLILDKEEIHLELESILNQDKGRGYRIYNCFNNVPMMKDKFKKASQKKVFFSSKSDIVRLDTGFHLFGLDDELTDTRFTYIHFHNRYYQGVIASARNKMIARVPDFTRETLTLHRERKKAGWHLVKYFLQEKEQYYKEKMTLDESSGNVFSVQFENYANSIGVSYPFTNLSADNDDDIFWLKTPSNLYAVDNQIKKELSIEYDKILAFSFGKKVDGFAFANIGYTDAVGFGWEGNPIKLVRDRDMGAPIFDSFALAIKVDKKFKVKLPNSTYKICIFMHDILFDNHSMSVHCGGEEVFSNVNTTKGEVTRLEFIVTNENSILELSLSSELSNFIINSITIQEVVDTPNYKKVIKVPIGELNVKKKSFSHKTLNEGNEKITCLEERLTNSIRFQQSSNECDYDSLVKGVVDYYIDYLTSEGEIIDPDLGVEHQYATPSFALACSSLVLKDEKYLHLALKSLEISIKNLVNRHCPNKHEDFFPYLISKTLLNLKDYIRNDVFEGFISLLEQVNPYATYRSPIGGSDKSGQNWNMLAAAGESILNDKTSASFVDNSLALQSRHFNFDVGFYAEGPMIYDLKPRVFWSDALISGYDGVFKYEMNSFLNLGALNSLSIQSPNGYLVPGGRSGNHIWGEALQCLLFEIYSKEYSSRENYSLAGLFHAGAKLSLDAIKRNIDISGDLNVSKNKFNPKLRHGYENYTSRSHYNLFAASLLGVAKSYYDGLNFQKINKNVQALALNEKNHLDLSDSTGRYVACFNGNQVVVDLGKNLKQNANGIIRCLLNNGTGLIEGSVSNASFSQLEPSIFSSISIHYEYKGEIFNLAACNSNKFESTLITPKISSDDITLSIKYSLTKENFILSTIVINNDGFLITFSSSKDIKIKKMTFPFLSSNGDDNYIFTEKGNVFTINDILGSYNVSFPLSSEVKLKEGEFSNKNGLIKIMDISSVDNEYSLLINKECCL